MIPILGLFGQRDDWLPQGTAVAARVDSIIFGLLVAGAAVVSILGALTAYILFRYRRGSDANRDPIRIPTWKIETGWTVVTLGVFLYFFVRGTSVYLDMQRIPEGEDVIHVVARQWMWDMRYENGRREFNALHLKQNSPVRLVLSSEDVIHSFFVPAFRMKQDAVPGRMVSVSITPTRTGIYTLFCAQYCGTAHAEMTGTITVMDPADYDAWTRGFERRSATADSSPIRRGRATYMRFGCGRCHEDPLGDRAPSLAGLYGNWVRLESGRTVRADEQYLRDSILLAPRYTVAGYPPGMPSYAGILSESEAVDLISYIESLKSPGAPLAVLR
jgi:cytochrome c oxidase subunit II